MIAKWKIISSLEKNGEEKMGTPSIFPIFFNLIIDSLRDGGHELFQREWTLIAYCSGNSS